MSQPEKTFRIGSVSASVFVNEAEDGSQFRTVSLQRRFKQGEEWKNSDSYTLRDLAAAIALLHLAMNHIAELEAASREQTREPERQLRH